jgi:hypothetical protein
MIVVSGCPRSGTSLMTNLIQTGLPDGRERLVGSQFMGIDKRGKFQKIKGEPKEIKECRKYIQTLYPDQSAYVDSSVDMNPDGFWECQYTVPGCFYRFQFADELQEFMDEKDGKKTDSICKIVSQGLTNSDPRYINKVVFMMRHPRAVAKSQERLKRQNNPMISQENRVVHTPDMFINVTITAMKWLEKYPDIPVLVIDYDELLNDPKPQLEKLFDFLGEGDIKKTDGIIKPKLRRSLPEAINLPQWKEAEKVHKWFLKKDFKGAINFSKNWRTYHNREHMSWICSRTNEQVNYKHCEACKAHKEIREQFKLTASMKNIAWEEEPCMYDCGYNAVSKEKKLTMNESVGEHTWLDD